MLKEIIKTQIGNLSRYRYKDVGISMLYSNRYKDVCVGMLIET